MGSRKNPAAAILNDATTKIKSLSDALGLSPQARASIVLDNQDDDAGPTLKQALKADYDLTLPDWTVERAYKQQRDNGAYDKIADKYHDPMTAYAFQVLEGTTMAGKDIKLACWRHLQDLTRIGQADFLITTLLISVMKC